MTLQVCGSLGLKVTLAQSRLVASQSRKVTVHKDTELRSAQGNSALGRANDFRWMGISSSVQYSLTDLGARASDDTLTLVSHSHTLTVGVFSSRSHILMLRRPLRLHLST